MSIFDTGDRLDSIIEDLKKSIELIAECKRDVELIKDSVQNKNLRYIHGCWWQDEELLESEKIVK